MPTPVQFKYYLRDVLGKYYYVSGGTVLTSVAKVDFGPAPRNWTTTTVSFSRNEKWFGIFRLYSVPIEFVITAAHIIRHVYYTVGGEGYLKFEIEKRNDSTWVHEAFYAGELDLSEATDTRDSINTTVLELGLPALIKANENIVYELPFQGDPDTATIVNEGIKLQANYYYVLPASPTPITANQNAPIDIIPYNEETFFKLGHATATSNQGVLNPELFFTAVYAFTGSVKIKVKINYLNTHATLSIKFRLRMLKFDSSGAASFPPIPPGTLLSTTTIYEDPLPLAPGANRTIDIDIDIPISMVGGTDISNGFIGDSLRINNQFINAATGLDITGATPDYSIVEDGKLNVLCEFIMPTSKTLAFRAFHVFEHVMNKISGGTAICSSAYLTDNVTFFGKNNPWNTFITCGMALRSIIHPVMKISLADIKQAFWSLWGLQLDVNGNNVSFKPWHQLFNPTVIHTVEGVKDQKTTVWKDQIYNLIRVGYVDQNYDELNGRQEFNSELLFSCGLRRSGSELNLISPIRADIFGIEYVRSRQFIGAGASKSEKFASETADTSSDNNNFFIHCNGTPVSGEYYVYRNPAATVTGLVVANSTAYNIGLTPKENFNRLKEFIKSFLPQGTVVKFQSSKKNKDFAAGVVASGTYVVESADVDTTTFTRYFLPYVHEFTGAVPNNLIALMTAMPYGTIQFLLDGNYFKGFILDIGIKPATREGNTYRLLSAPTNDLTKLIN